YQGTMVEPTGIPNVSLPAGVTSAQRQAQLDLIGGLNQRHLELHAGNSELEARIRSYELAFRMQTAAPDAFDLAGETQATKNLYGIGETDTAEFGTLCL